MLIIFISMWLPAAIQPTQIAKGMTYFLFLSPACFFSSFTSVSLIKIYNSSSIEIMLSILIDFNLNFFVWGYINIWLRIFHFTFEELKNIFLYSIVFLHFIFVIFKGFYCTSSKLLLQTHYIFGILCKDLESTLDVFLRLVWTRRRLVIDNMMNIV